MMAIKKVLIVKLWAIGDIVMATPMLEALKKSDPKIYITWLIDSNNYDVLKNHPLINELIPIDTGRWRKMLKKGNIEAWWESASGFSRRMSDRNFDAVINCHPEKIWTVLFCRAKQRVALFPKRASLLSRLFYTKSISRPLKPPVHNTVHYLLATRALGIPDGDLDLSVGPEPDNEDFRNHVFARLNMSDDRLQVLVAPFSTGENRNWPKERYLQLIDWLTKRHDAHVIVTSSATERTQLRLMMKGFENPDVTFTDYLQSPEYIEVVRRSNLVISGDSSPMHIAAATGVPFVALFGPTPVYERAPLVGKGVVVHKELSCSPCDRTDCHNVEFQKCMKLIDLESVQDAVDKVLLGGALETEDAAVSGSRRI